VANLTIIKQDAGYNCFKKQLLYFLTAKHTKQAQSTQSQYNLFLDLCDLCVKSLRPLRLMDLVKPIRL
jgi:hypothetical protein